MNGKRTFGDVMPAQQMKAFMNVLYNRWFLKWSKREIDEAAWEELAGEANQIMSQGEQYPVVKNLVIAMLYELDARMHGGYTETSKKKLLELIGKEVQG